MVYVDDPSKYAYHSVKIEPVKREISRLTKSVYKNKELFTFDGRKEREVYLGASKQDGYLNKVYNLLK